MNWICLLKAIGIVIGKFLLGIGIAIAVTGVIYAIAWTIGKIAKRDTDEVGGAMVTIIIVAAILFVIVGGAYVEYHRVCQ